MLATPMFFRPISSASAPTPGAEDQIVEAVFVDSDGDPTDFGEGGDSYVLPDATTSTRGGVLQAAAVSDAEGASPTATEYNALLAALRTAGILATA